MKKPKKLNIFIAQLVDGHIEDRNFIVTSKNSTVVLKKYIKMKDYKIVSRIRHTHIVAGSRVLVKIHSKGTATELIVYRPTEAPKNVFIF